MKRWTKKRMKITKSERVLREYLKVYTPPEKADIDYLVKKTGVRRKTVLYALYAKVAGYARGPHTNDYREKYKNPKERSFSSRVIGFIDKNPEVNSLDDIQKELKVENKKRDQIKSSIRTWRPDKFEEMFGDLGPEEGSNSEMVVKRFDILVKSEKFISLSDIARDLKVPISTVHDALSRWRPQYKLFLKKGAIDPVDALADAFLSPDGETR